MVELYLHPSVSLETLKVYQAEATRLGVTVDELAAEVVAFWALIPPATREKAPAPTCDLCGRAEMVSQTNICEWCYEDRLA